MKIISWNVNSLKVRLPHLLALLAQEQPDVVGLQELKCENELFPVQEIQAAGYHVSFNGQKTYNGVALISRFPLENIQFDIPNFQDEQKRVIAATINKVRIINIYLPNGQEVGSDKYAYKLEWLSHFHDYLKSELEQYPSVLVMGDFNIAPADADIHKPALWQDKILCSAPERSALQQLFDLKMQDAFRLFSQTAQQFSWWDYRNGGFEKNEGLRIDLILLNPALNARCLSSDILFSYRGLERPSDHAPVSVVLFDNE